MQTNCILSALILILKKFICQPLCCVPFQIQTFYQNLVLVAVYHVDCGQALLRRLLRQISSARNLSQKYITKRTVTLKISKFVDE